ncbi:MAG TPA: AAA family ATPase, partial [Myxococcota bacterium]|nr:AAA family ATPase [Myxococcota bacterium]
MNILKGSCTPMLIEFRVANHRSIREEQALTFAAGRGGDPADGRQRAVAGATEVLLPLAAIYGANASGKSNILAALAFMRDAVADSHRIWVPEGGVPRDPFAWAERSTPSLFELTFLVGGTRFEYGFST